MICPHCGQDHPDKIRFCTKTGQRIQLACPNCKNQVQVGSRFCPYCRTTLDPSAYDGGIDEVSSKRSQNSRWWLFLVIGIGIISIILIAAFLLNPIMCLFDIYCGTTSTLTPPVGGIIVPPPHARPMLDGRAMGEQNAPVTIEIFDDFQCPACKSFSEQIEPMIVDSYVTPGVVYYIYRFYPFLDDKSPGKESDQAANASMCAGEQNRFWDYHDLLFANWDGENQGAFNDIRLVAFAEILGLDMSDFKSCFDQNKYWDEISADLTSGTNSGVTGTPSVFVNGRLISPGFVPSISQISDAVEAELAKSGD